MRKTLLIACATALGIATSACGGDAQRATSATSAPTVTPPPATPRVAAPTVPPPPPAASPQARQAAPPPAPTEPAPLYPPVQRAGPSGGLGLARAEWEGERGPERPNNVSRALHMYEPGITVVLLVGNVWGIEQRWPTMEPRVLASAREAAAALLPGDASLTRSYLTGPRNLYRMDVLTSAWLTARFPTENWGGAPPDTFSVRYQADSVHRPVDAAVSGFVVKPGDRPEGQVQNGLPR